MVKRRSEKKNQSFGAAHQLTIDSAHGARRTARFGGAAHDSPGLRDRVDPAFRVFSGTERRAIIEVSAAIPFAVPAIAFQRRFQSAHVEPPGLGTFMFTARIRNFGKLPKNRVQEPAEPNAFSLAMLADAIHAVVPVARAHQWQAVAADRETAVQRARAMFKQRRASLRNTRLEIGFVLALGQRIALQKRHDFVQHGRFAGRFDEVG